MTSAAIASASQNSNRFAFSDKETAVMSIATALGGCQLLIINRLRGKGTASAISLADPTTRTIGAIGGISLGLGLAGLFDKAPIGRTTAASLLGYGLSTLISIGIPVVTTALVSGGSSSPHPAR